jgi:glucose 1-dehydrogenase/3-oxoacyl-[acyl-carrier protein] reductase
MKLQGKTAVVTGAGRGIGKGIALELAKEGADVLLHYNHSAAPAEALGREIEKLGRRAVTARADMRDLGEIRVMMKKAREELGLVDILVANAALTENHDFFDITEEDWDRTQEINLKGLFFTSQEAARQMKAKGGGKIVFIGSVHSMTTLKGFTVYAASKGGVDALTRQMALELASCNVAVNTVSPGLIEVEKYLDNPQYDREHRAGQIPIGRVGFPVDIAKAVVFLASPDSDYITGQVLAVDGGQLTQLSLKRDRSEQ